tara:strand:- start:203 stop:655 length:453 start_codon:yes stop_codon:yes gene_type:complete
MLILNKILGYVSDIRFSEKIHLLSNLNSIEYLNINPNDTSRRRIRITSDQGTDCAISLSRNEKLSDGAILNLSTTKAIVVKMMIEKWLSVKVCDLEAALKLGYFVGNLHWRVRFKEDLIFIALEGPKQTYIERLNEFIMSKKIRLINGAD